MSRSRLIALAALLMGLMVAASILEPRFVSPPAQGLLASHVWELAIVAIPMLLIIMMGGIDLSVGSMVALSAVTFGMLFEKGTPVGWAVMAALAVGAFAGFLNGWLVVRTKVHPLLITLGSMAAFRGIAEGMSLARPISGYPESFLSWSAGAKPGITFFLLAVIAHLLITRFRTGRWIASIGVSETASRFSKLPVDRVKIALYSLCGLSCGLAAILLVARNNTAKADMGMGLELEAITAVVLGGAKIEGGKGSVIGLVLALALLHQTREFVSWHWKQNELHLVIMGALLLFALLFDRFFLTRKRLRA